MTLSYDGRAYRGWQRQKNTRNTIQGQISTVIERAFEQSIDLQGASRTDAGVHALGQVASFVLDTILSPEQIKQTINRYLPEDIAVLDCTEVPRDWHVRHAVKYKTYRYTIYEHDKPDVFRRHIEWTIPEELDREKMRQAIGPLIGKQDFAGYTVGRNKKTIRTIHSIEMEAQVEENGRRLFLTIRGDGFLHHMIRLIVGTLVAIGRGEAEPSLTQTILEQANRSLAILAPAQGLCLMDITYD